MGRCKMERRPGERFADLMKCGFEQVCCNRHEIGWRDGGKDLAFRMRLKVVQVEQALALLRTALSEREEFAETPVCGAICRVDQKARPVLQIKPGSDDNLEPHLLGSDMCPNHAGKGVAVGNGESLMTQCLGRRNKLLGMTAAAQEREVRRYLEFCVWRVWLEHCGWLKWLPLVLSGGIWPWI